MKPVLRPAVWRFCPLRVLPFLFLLLVAAPAPSLAGEPDYADPALSGLTAHRVYPHAERAQRLADEGRHAQAVLSWQAALRRAPDHPPLLRGLVDSLVAAGQYAEAHAWAERLPEPQGRSIRDELRLQWLDAETPDPARVSEWLADSGFPALLIWRGVDRTVQRRGEAGALEWLAELDCAPAGVCPLVQRERLARMTAHDDTSPAELADLLAEMDAESPLSDRERAARIEALIEAGRLSEAGEELARTEEDEAFVSAAARLLGESLEADPDLAEAVFVALEGRGLLDEDGEYLWIGFLVDRQDPGAALERAEAAGLPCLDRASLAVAADRRGHAERTLSDCDPARDPDRWLWLAVSLGAWSLVESVGLEGEAESRRRDQLLEHYRRSGDDAALVALVGADAPVARQRERAEAELRMDDPAAAGATFLQIHRETGELADLDRASFLLSTAGEEPRALAALAAAAPFGDEGRAAELTDRLLYLAERSTDTPDPTWVRAVVEDSQRLSVQRSGGALLARTEVCAAEAADPPGLQYAVGLCLIERDRPEAIAALQRVWEQELSAAGPPLAWALAAEGQPEDALAVWDEVDAEDMDNEAWQAKTRAALAAGRTEQAGTLLGEHARAEDPQWLRLSAQSARMRGEPDQARDDWLRIHDHSPSAESARVLAELANEAGRTEERREWLREALRHDPGDPGLWRELAYAALPLDREESIFAMEQARSLEAPRYGHELELGYLYAAVGEREQARAALRRGLDAMDEQPPEPGEPEALRLDQAHAARRTHERLGRDWDFGALGWVASGSVPGELVFPESAPRNHAELWATRPIDPYGDTIPGSLEAFGRVIGEGPGDDALASRAAVAGLRWQPWPGVVSLGIQRVEPQRAPGEWVVTAATQQLDRGAYRADWRPAETRWWERAWYAEAAWWERSAETQVYTRYDHRRHWRWRQQPGSSFVYGLAEGHRRSAGEDLRVGAGVGIRFHSNAGPYDAWSRRHTLRLEHHRALSTDLAEDSGWFLRLESTW